MLLSFLMQGRTCFWFSWKEHRNSLWEYLFAADIYKDVSKNRGIEEVLRRRMNGYSADTPYSCT